MHWLALCLALIVAGCAPRSEAPAPGPTSPTTPTRTNQPSPPPRPTSSPALAREPRVMILCTTQEPTSLLWSEATLATHALLEAIQEPLVDARSYGYQANLIEKLPSFQDGDATLESVTLSADSRFYDVQNDRVLTLTAGMDESFALAQFDAAPMPQQGWDGATALTTVQLTARWRLVDGLSWEDGRAVTADDSLFAFQIASDPAWPASHYLVERTASYQALDERTLEWRGLPGYTDGTFFLNLFNPQPRHHLGTLSVAQLLTNSSANRAPLSYGPYRLLRWEAGDSIELAPNENYVRGLAPLDRLVIRFVPTTENLISQLVNGGCDVGLQDAGFEATYPLLQSFVEEGLLEIQEVAGSAFEHLDFNLQAAEGYNGGAATLRDTLGGLLFRDVNFRRAIAYCLDRQAIVDGATNGAAFVQHSYTAANHPLYPGDEAIIRYPFDPARGRALLAELGWVDSDGDGVRDDGAGSRLSFRYSTRTNQLRERVLQIVQAQLLDHCGIESQLEHADSEFFADGPDGPLFGRRYDMAQFAWLTGVEPPCNLYLSGEVPNETNGWGASNNTGFASTAFDLACTGALQALDESEKRRLHAEAMRLFSEALPSIPLFARAKITLVRPGVQGVLQDPTANSELWNVENFDVRDDD